MQRFVKLSNIRISEEFKKSAPSRVKMEKCRSYWNVLGKQDRYIVLDNTHTLIDGYIQYLILKEAGCIYGEAVTYVGTKDSYSGEYHRKDNNIYVGARHKNLDGWSKEYVWRIPYSWITNGQYKALNVEDEILVQTKFGLKNVYITRIGGASDFPGVILGDDVKKVVKNLCAHRDAVKEYDINLAKMLGYIK